MNKFLTVACCSFIAGVYVGYANEYQLESLCRQTRRQKKKAMHKVHEAYDQICDCMDCD